MQPRRSVTFAPDTKPERDFLPAKVLACALAMDVTGVFPDIGPFAECRSGRECLALLGRDQRAGVRSCLY
jgi:hypothetical protein